VELAERPEVRWRPMQQRERGVRKGVERTVGKASGDGCVLYTSARVRLADEAGPTPCQTPGVVRRVTRPLNRMP
jgi:hypothetical protein